MFSVHTAPKGFEYATITDHFGFVFNENSVREITWLSFSKNSVFNMFSVHHRTKSHVRVSEILVSRCVSATLSRVSAAFQFADSWDFVLCTRKRKAGHFKFLQFEERFRKPPQEVVDCRPNLILNKCTKSVTRRPSVHSLS